MAANSTISIGFKIEDKGNGVKELILNGKNLREVMRANVEVAQKLQSSFINLAAVTTFLKNATLATITIQPHCKNRLTPEKLLPLPWDGIKSAQSWVVKPSTAARFAELVGG